MSNIPFVDAYNRVRQTDSVSLHSVYVACPWCERRHTHGRVAVGIRSSDCGTMHIGGVYRLHIVERALAEDFTELQARYDLGVLDLRPRWRRRPIIESATPRSRFTEL